MLNRHVIFRFKSPSKSMVKSAMFFRGLRGLRGPSKRAARRPRHQGFLLEALHIEGHRAGGNHLDEDHFTVFSFCASVCFLVFNMYTYIVYIVYMYIYIYIVYIYIYTYCD